MTTDEKQALQKWASEECRGAKQQIRHIIRAELLKRGLLPAVTQSAAIPNGELYTNEMFTQ